MTDFLCTLQQRRYAELVRVTGDVIKRHHDVSIQLARRAFIHVPFIVLCCGLTPSFCHGCSHLTVLFIARYTHRTGLIADQSLSSPQTRLIKTSLHAAADHRTSACSSKTRHRSEFSCAPRESAPGNWVIYFVFTPMPESKSSSDSKMSRHYVRHHRLNELNFEPASPGLLFPHDGRRSFVSDSSRSWRQKRPAAVA